MCSGLQSVLGYIELDGAVGVKADPLCGKIGADRGREYLLSVADKNFCTEAVQNQSQLQFALIVTDLGPPLVNDGPAGAREFPVDLQDGFVRTEADSGLIFRRRSNSRIGC